MHLKLQHVALKTNTHHRRTAAARAPRRGPHISSDAERRASERRSRMADCTLRSS